MNLITPSQTPVRFPSMNLSRHPSFAHPELAVLPSSSHSPPPYTPNIRKATNVAISPSTVGLMLTGRIAPVKNLDVDVKFLQRES
jgi:hypothetical protein